MTNSLSDASPIFWALCSNIAFASASVIFTSLSKKTSAAWMNFTKGLVASVCFLLVCVFGNLWIQIPFNTFAMLAASGVCGLLIGDIFLLRAFTHLGSGRTLMIFSFQPLILGVAGYYLFNQDFSPFRFLAILLLIGCLVSFGFESLKEKGHWDLPGLGFALVGISLDAFGLLLTKAAFEATPEMSPFQVNLIRSSATTIGFLLASMIPFLNFKIKAPWHSLSSKERNLALVSSVLGTFVALGCYMFAVRNGHLASISALAGTSPLFATILESITGKKKFNRYLFAGTLFFIFGLGVLVLT